MADDGFIGIDRWFADNDKARLRAWGINGNESTVSKELQGVAPQGFADQAHIFKLRADED